MRKQELAKGGTRNCLLRAELPLQKTFADVLEEIYGYSG